ncbi:MAG: hypothetical protein RL205_1779 [Actinomycetota bacterium]
MAPDTGLMVARGGVEPPTFRFSVGRSYQLSYLAVPHEEAVVHSETEQEESSAGRTPS